MDKYRSNVKVYKWWEIYISNDKFKKKLIRIYSCTLNILNN